jgi:cytosine/adenosine deaminase-related metal-dependent hydrolase
MESVMSSKSYTSRWVFPVDQPPVENGIIMIQGSTISSVAPRGTKQADVDLGNVAIVPGFVNAHTHLDLSDAAGLYPPTADFTLWLRHVIGHRRRQSPEGLLAAITAGIRESLRFGVTALGDISAKGSSWDALAESPLGAVIYHEAIGLSQERGAACFERVRDWFETRPALMNCKPGISPHAPYTVGRSLLEKVVAFRAAKLAAGASVPLAIHLAETRAELELLLERSGPFVEFLQEFGVYDSNALATDMDAFYDIADASFVHANYANPVQLVHSGPRAVIYCPRTHAAFGHTPYRLREFLQAGITVALGTDSLASNPDLNVLLDARHVFGQFPDLPGATLLGMITANGAKMRPLPCCRCRIAMRETPTGCYSTRPL